MKVDVKVENEHVIVNLRKMTPKIREALVKELTRQSRVLTTYVKDKHLTGGTSSSKLAVRTGHLRRSTRPMTVIATDDYIEGGVLFGAKYAATHVGPPGKRTTITPKKAKALAIPIMSGVTAAGVSREVLGPRGVTGLTYIKRKGKPPLLAKVTKKAMYPWYVLKRSVTVPARVHPSDILRAKSGMIIEGIQHALDKVTK